MALLAGFVLSTLLAHSLCADAISNKQHSNDSVVRQNYVTENEATVNNLINHCFASFYAYTSLEAYFERDDVDLLGFGKLTSDLGKEDLEWAQQLIDFQNLRGGRVGLMDIKRPEREDYGSGLEAFTGALANEKVSNGIFIDAHATAVKNGDPLMADFIANKFLHKKAERIRKLASIIRDIKRSGQGLGEFQVDKTVNEEVHHHKHSHGIKHHSR